MNEILRVFNGDMHTKNALKEFIHQYIREEGANMIMERKSVEHVADAYDLINKAFQELELIYGIPEKPTTPKNHAR